MSGQGKLFYTSPENSLASLELTDVILGWERNMERTKAAAQTNIIWMSSTGKRRSQHHILYERRNNGRYFNFSVLNELKQGGRKNILKLYHNVEARNSGSLTAHQEASVDLGGSFVAKILHRIGKDSTNSYKHVLQFLWKRGATKKNIKIDNGYKLIGSQYKVISKLTNNALTLARCDLTVTSNLSQNQSFILKANGHVKGKRFSFLHKHNYTYAGSMNGSYELEQTIDLPFLNRKIGVESKAANTRKPLKSFVFLVKPDKERSAATYGFKQEVMYVQDPNYKIALDSIFVSYWNLDVVTETKKNSLQSH